MPTDSPEARPRFVWSRWSAGRRLAASVLTLSVFVAAAVGWWWIGSAEFTAIRRGSPTELRSLQALLRQSGVNGRLAGSDAGTRLEVPAEDVERSRSILRDGPVEAARSQSKASASIWSGGAFGSALGQAEAKRLKEQRIEEAIRSNPNVKSVSFFENREEPELFQPTSAKKSAGVWLVLRPGVPSISAAEARSIRELVSGALGVEGKNVAVVDNIGNRYSASHVNSLDVERRIKKKIEDLVYGLYVRPYEPWEFHLGVVVKTSDTATLIEEEKHEYREVTLRADLERDASGAVTRQQIEDEPLKVGSTRERKDTPAGQLESVDVDLRLDVAAVKRILQARHREFAPPGISFSNVNLEERVVDYALEQQELLLGLLSPYKADVNVSAEVLRVGTSSPVEVATPLANSDLLSDSKPWTLLFSAFGALFFLSFVFVLRGRRPSSQQTLDSRTRDIVEEPAAPSQAIPECHGTLDLARRAATTVRDRPDVAQSVFRFWMTKSEDANADDSVQALEPALSGDHAETPVTSEPLEVS